MATDKPKAKTLYHSQLTKLGPVMVTVKSDVRKSQFAGKPDFCYIVINGEEFGYSFDSPACQKFFTGQKGRSFMIKAEGRDADATITYLGEPGSQKFAAPAPPPDAQPPQVYDSNPPGRPGGPPLPPEKTPPCQPTPAPAANVPPAPPGSKMDLNTALLESKRFAGRRAGLLKIAAKAMLNFKAEWDALPEVQAHNLQMTGDQFWGKVTTIYLSMESQGLAIRGGFADALSTKLGFGDISNPAKTPVCQKCGGVHAAGQCPEED